MEEELNKFIKEKIKKDTKATNSIYRLVLGTIIALEISSKIVLDWIECAKNDKVFSSLDFLKGGNWISNIINKNHIKLMQGLFECRPSGLGTPNAACGEGELMLILSSTKILRPSKNDIKVDEIYYNLKNEYPRIFADINGIKLNEIMLKECDDLNLIPNKDNKNKMSVQIVNKSFIKNHWNPQFKQLKKEQLVSFLSVFISNLFPNKNVSEEEIIQIVENSVEENQIEPDKWTEQLIIFIYKYCSEKFENLLTMNIDGVVRVIPPSHIVFKEKVELGIIKFDKDYFRMHQDKKVGIYIKF
jgi:hypothetical protein